MSLLETPAGISGAALLILCAVIFIWAIWSLVSGIRAQKNYGKASLPRLPGEEETEEQVADETLGQDESPFYIEEYDDDEIREMDDDELFLASMTPKARKRMNSRWRKKK